jgi:asparagine synthase (glutamine-hydrolysing)
LGNFVTERLSILSKILEKDMCGIAGIYSFKGEAKSKDIKKMTNSLRHRGPDDEGFLAVNLTLGKVFNLTGAESKTPGPKIEEFNEPVNLFLGHRRLSIIDLSPAGHQPMCNENGSLWIVYNGEIYNYLEIRRELLSLDHQFKSQTDTEVILHAYEEWETDCLNHFNGMWAFAILDLQKKTIFCSRDRAGVKPFYYFYDGKRFCFASEITALLELDGFGVEPNEQIIADYLLSGLLDHTHETFFKNIRQLRPGEYLLIEADQLAFQTYWDIEAKEVWFPRESDYAERFYELLQDSIHLRMRSDVPIGTCLSGGLDSSSIVCLVNKLMFDGQFIDSRGVGERQKTFSSCFEDPAYDERKFIELVIHQTGAEKNYVFPKAEDLFQDLPTLIRHQEEPFGSTSIYAQWRVMGRTKEREVKVLLDGQGGDEILAGYSPSFYFLLKHFLKRCAIKSMIDEIRGLRKTHPFLFDQWIAKMFYILFPKLNREIELVEKGFRKKYFRNFSKPAKFDNDLDNYLYYIFRYLKLPALLHYVDRNSMAFSLETRLPFLDYRLVEYTFGLPAEQKIGKGVTKVILRNAMEKAIPEEIRNRMDKMGFVTPEGTWFKTILRNQINEIIGSKSFAERGYFEVKKVKEKFIEHCEGKIDINLAIWRCLNLELWFRNFIDKNPLSQGWEMNGN